MVKFASRWVWGNESGPGARGSSPLRGVAGRKEEGVEGVEAGNGVFVSEEKV